MHPVMTPDPTTPPPLNAYWNERLKQLWIDLYCGAFFLHGASAAQHIKDAQEEYEINFYPGQEDESADAY